MSTKNNVGITKAVNDSLVSQTTNARRNNLFRQSNSRRALSWTVTASEVSASAAVLLLPRSSMTARLALRTSLSHSFGQTCKMLGCAELKDDPLQT